ncbi:cytochrome P450 [Gordonia sp. HNM0687]|uniref:Cytochrome P450 n=1 Tax=Gordonia mangrovi TaxID=2665643 RepID=A0A6L7GJ78_9ACTN|nr:cytochrome P450 [Gordonia mangrovi]MXP19916.1 cytochrome P450 [Gordonia mangrovi]UVF79462.1 cytochrome P450 [Gordonia mangrovi]
MTTSAEQTFDEIDFTDPLLLERGLPLREFAERRATAPVWWNPQAIGPAFFDDEGFWVVSRHADIRAISKDTATWSNWAKGAVMRMPETSTREQVEASRAFLLNMDPPEHTRMRKIVSRMFTPRAVATLEESLARHAREVVSNAAQTGTGNFVEDIAIHLPLRAILDLLGVPESDHAYLCELADSMVNPDDPDSKYDPFTANVEMLNYASAMAEDRRTTPRDDIVTVLVQADIDGHALSETEFGLFVILLVIAGNETTRNAISNGINAFLDNPGQWDLYRRERPATAVDEAIRWATPVHCFQRTATCDTEVGGVPIAAGQRVGLFYSSANYDEEVFDDPFAFDITRDPNPHLSFGGNGAHFCIGANLARLEVNTMFNTLADIVPDMTKLAEPQRVRSGWLNGVKDLQVSYRPDGR